MKITKKKVTMKDIAEKLNISINAVSLALNDKHGVSEETKKLIFETANQMGYFEDKLLNKGFKNICVLIEEKNFYDTTFYTKVILGIETESKKNNFDMLIRFMNLENFQIPTCIESRKVSGILIVGNIRDEHLRMLLKYNIPIVLVDHATLELNLNAILTQNMIGSYLATRHLIKNGHSQIGFVGEIDFSLSFKQRWLGFEQAMKDYGLKVDIDYCITEKVEQFVLAKKYNEFASVISQLSKLPTAWICSNDNTAITLYNALKILGKKVPEDISIIGFDDIESCKIITPNLTTVYVDKELMGKKAVKKLLQIMGKPKQSTEHIYMEVKLIERDSVKCLIK
ncbi:LacI family DNA-binding transcriptional regulator [Anaerobranca gottschalkii]|uniref:Transcriptional regulator, LacI family n=1 Tax=Anaerobranca gottschalkii DSM 13577 TaxID=1120990 RepID=A0A1H9YHK5_9FIRM|nr:LacI family DNA-binding transcriptional regulator [Anaerobranca gottschalkii]SES68457.1 transcriptional regulator, LacI family [Anaerobranca gottschalkii DSM 13577]